MVVHWDEMPWETVDRGELRWSRQRLAPGLSRFRAEPGARIMPAHVHVDEEELVVVLAGAGYSWQDCVAHPIRGRDVVLHRPDAEVHTLIAGDGALEVLFFARGSTTGRPRLPRAGVIRVGDGVWPLDADPFAAEPPLELATPCAQRPDTILSFDDLPKRPWGRGSFGGRIAGVEGALSGLNRCELPAGGGRSPAHHHTAAAGKVVLLHGSGQARIGGGRHPPRARAGAGGPPPPP